ncbi:MAG: sulfatase, partial [Planctomycetota bacterium]
MDGVSFAPLLAGDESRYPRRDLLYWEQGCLGLNVQSALLDERYFALRMEPGEPTRLFDIFDDPGCTRDLAEGHPEL